MSLGYAKLASDYVIGISNGVAKRNAIKSDANYQKSINHSNLVISEASKDFAVRRIEDAKRKMASSQVVATAVSGAMFDGSAAHVAVETAKQYNLDIFAEEFNFKVQKYDHDVRARELELNKKQATRDMIGGFISSTFSTTLKGISMGAMSSGTSNAYADVPVNDIGVGSHSYIDDGIVINETFHI